MKLSDYTQYNSQFPGREVIDEPLWDTQPFTAATLALQFFNGVRATLNLSNMTQAGQLPAPDSFLVRAIRLYLVNRPESYAAVAVPAIQLGSMNDMAQVLYNGALTFIVGQKDYGIYPAHTLPAGGGAWGQLAVNRVTAAGFGVDFARNGLPHVQNTFSLAKPVLIKSQINFQVNMFWNAAIATLVRTVNICVVLDGDRIRAIQ